MTSTQNIEAEKYLLSCVMIDPPNVLSSAMAIGISAESFVDPTYRTMWNILHGMLVAGDPIDVETVFVATRGHSREMADLGINIGYASLEVLFRAQSTTARAMYFAKAVRDAAILRKLVGKTAKIDESVREAGTQPAAEILHDATSAILSIEATQHAESWAQITKGVLADFAARTDPNSPPVDNDSISFGFEHMDSVFGPMRPGQMIVLAARPSIGKSSLARQIAIEAAVSYHKQVLFCSLEVMGKELAWNMAQTLSRHSAKHMNASAHPADQREFKAALDKINAPTLDVLAASAVSLAAIRARLEVMRAKQTPVRLLVVDYIGLMPDAAPNKGEHRAQSVGRVSRELKRIALEYNLVVLVLSQLNRDSSKDEGEPQMHHLRESGDIEQDADKIILLHRPGTNPQTGADQVATASAKETPSFYILAIQAKGRDDGTGTVGLTFRRAITRFEQPSKK